MDSLPGDWLNGVWHDCAGIATSGYVCGIVVAGGHVYMAGVDRSATYDTPEGPEVPVWWIDGVKHILPEGPDPDGSANVWESIPASSDSTHILAVGNDIHIAGNTWTTQGSEVPIVWKNGQPATLPYSGNQAFARHIAVGGSVYVSAKPTWAWDDAGDPATPLVWKDGSLVGLAYVGTDTNARMFGMAAIGHDVFIVGITGTGASGTGFVDYNNPIHPAFWENGVLQELPMGGKSGGTIGWSGLLVGMP